MMEEDWRGVIKHELSHPTLSSIPILKDFSMMDGSLYHRGPEGILARCISNDEASSKLDQAHQQWCGEEGQKTSLITLPGSLL